MTAGILNLDKPIGWTSHDVVARVRKLTGERHTGHAGTLDPLATGVLLVCLGSATRLVEYLQATRKTYRATVRLGISTDSGAGEGVITPVPPLTEADIEVVLAAFRGPIVQRPPAHSALKQDGVPLYRRVRRGETVEAPTRTITIYALDIVTWTPPDLLIDVICSPGTYIRSLAFDLGERIGCGGYLAGLCRTASGRFTLADAVSLDRLAAAAVAGEWQKLLQPAYLALDGFTRIVVDAADEARLQHGLDVTCPQPPPTEQGYALSATGECVALLRYDAERQAWRPYKVLTAG